MLIPQRSSLLATLLLASGLTCTEALTTKTTAKTTSTTKPASTAKVSSSTHVTTSSKPTSSVKTTPKINAVSTTSKILPNPTSTHISLPSTFLRGVNIGGWLIDEPWMNTMMGDAPDELTFDQESGTAALLASHWSSWFVEADVQAIASFGMNVMRIPIGYWAFDNSGSDFITGAEYWLDQAISWARTYGVMVLVDLHGSPGSQNGFEHSGDVSQINWQEGSNSSFAGPNMYKSLEILQTIAAKYGSSQYEGVVLGIEIVNEPLGWAPNDFTVTKNWAAVAWNVIKAAATNPNLYVLTHDSFMGPQNWYDVASAINSNSQQSLFGVDIHVYQNQAASDSSLNLTGHIAEACNYANTARNSLLPVIVGEFSAQINICVNPDGSTFGDDGTQECTVSGCQCLSSLPLNEWSATSIAVSRIFLEAQLEAFEYASDGYMIWSLNGPGAWSLIDLVNYGILGPTLYDRQYPGICNFVVG